jgi:hypothetical protein
MDVLIAVQKPELVNSELLAKWQGTFRNKVVDLSLRDKLKKMTVFPTFLVEMVFDQTADPAKLVLMETWAQQPAV